MKNASQNARASASEPNRSGKAGQYFSVLNCASLYGLSLETCGREWDAGDAEVDQQLRDGFGGHRGAPVGVEQRRADPVHGHRLLDALLGELAASSRAATVQPTT